MSKLKMAKMTRFGSDPNVLLVWIFGRTVPYVYLELSSPHCQIGRLSDGPDLC